MSAMSALMTLPSRAPAAAAAPRPRFSPRRAPTIRSRASRGVPLAGAATTSPARSPRVAVRAFPSRTHRPLAPFDPPRRARRARPVAPSAAMSDVVQRVASPKGRVESEELPKQLRDDVLDAVESLGGRCTVGDVAAAAGCKVSDAERALTAVAADTLAALEVSAEGDLLYVFPDGGRVRGAVAAKSARIRVFEPALETIGKVGSYLARVTFGTTLLASIAIVYAAIFALLSSKDSDRDDRRSSSDSGGGMMFGGPRFYISPFDYLWYWDPYYYERRAYMAELEGARDMNFLEAVFSFVFGDGDPNRDFERRRWALVGLCIQKNGGVVSAEQLAPFLDRDENTVGTDDESFVLPALTRFGGAPEVDPSSGEILYRFESFESTSGGFEQIREVLDAAPRGLSTGVAEEEEVRFSLATGGQRTMAAALGVFNFVGVVVLSYLCGQPQIIAENRELVAAVLGILPALKIYAASFFAIPAVRSLFIGRQNARINERNERRLEASKQVARPGKLLKAKMDAARRAAAGQRRVVRGGDDAVFTSAKSASDFEAEEFERKLKERAGE